MAEQTEKKRSGAAIYVISPFLLLLLTGGILILCYYLAPTHRLQKYLNIAFMDNLNKLEDDFTYDMYDEFKDYVKYADIEE